MNAERATGADQHAESGHGPASIGERKPVLAIDGPSGAGKSTVASALAAALGVEHLDTGAMYRAVAFAALRDGVPVDDGDALARLATAIELGLGPPLTVDGVDASVSIRSAEVTAVVSQVSAHSGVRANMLARQREWVAARHGAVVEGRDIGTVVLPGADVKVYLTASEAERARRRAAEGGQSDAGAVASAALSMAARDLADSRRTQAPLAAAPDALVIDSTDRAVEDIVKEVLAAL